METHIDYLACRYREAWWISKRLPSGIRLGHSSGWPEMIFDQREQMRRAEREILNTIPDNEQVERLMECIQWLTPLVDEERKLIWYRASGLAWREIAQQTGVPRSSVHRHWHKALLRIALHNGFRQ